MTEIKRLQRQQRAYFLEKKKKELRARNKRSYDYKWKGYEELMDTQEIRFQMIEMALISQYAFDLCHQK
jgi:hypothetical protein